MWKRFVGVCLLLLASLLLFACEGGDGNIIDPNKLNPWETEEPSLEFILQDDGTYSVSAGDFLGAKEIVIPATHEGKAVTKIANNAFADAVGLSKITIPNSVTEIGTSAFRGCLSLESFAWPAQITHIPNNVFADCALLTEITIPSGVVSIGSTAFKGCTELTEVFIPEGVTTIGAQAFGGCANLTYISIPSSVNNVGDGAFADDIEETRRPLRYRVVDGDVYLGNDQNPCVVLVKVNSRSSNSYTVKPETNVIYTNAFRSYSTLTSVTLHERIGSIGQYAFLSCTRLTSVHIPATVVNIGAGAFYNCTRLQRVEGFTGVRTIGASAFKNCKKLESISLPSELDSVGTDAFAGCLALTFTEEDNVRYLGNEQNPYVLLFDATDKTKSTYEINARTRIVYIAAFSYCDALESIVIPNSVHRMMDSVFWGCTALKNVKLSDNAISLGNHIFYNCSAIETLVIPSSVQSIGGSFLVGCSALKDLSIPFVGANLNGSGNTNFGYLFGIGKFTQHIDSKAFPKGLHTVRVTNCERILEGAFYDCKGIAVVSLPATLHSISKGAFGFCSGIKKVIIEDVASWCAVNFADDASNPLSYGAQLFLGEEKITDLVIPESVTSISGDAFYHCNSLQSVTFGSNVKELGHHAFYGCSNLQTVVMNENIEVVGNSAFEKCEKLVNVTLGKELVNVGSALFRDCKALVTITIPEDVVGIGMNAFLGCDKLESVEFENKRGWYTSLKNFNVNGDKIGVRDEEENAELLKGDCGKLYWYRQ